MSAVNYNVPKLNENKAFFALCVFKLLFFIF